MPEDSDWDEDVVDCEHHVEGPCRQCEEAGEYGSPPLFDEEAVTEFEVRECVCGRPFEVRSGAKPWMVCPACLLAPTRLEETR